MTSYNQIIVSALRNVRGNAVDAGRAVLALESLGHTDLAMRLSNVWLNRIQAIKAVAVAEAVAPRTVADDAFGEMFGSEIIQTPELIEARRIEINSRHELDEIADAVRAIYDNQFKAY